MQEGEFDEISPDISQYAVAVYVNKLESWRLTLTPNFINSAKCIIFLISGEKKKDSFQKMIKGDPELPASWITCNKVFYYVTKDCMTNGYSSEPDTFPLTISLQN